MKKKKKNFETKQYQNQTNLKKLKEERNFEQIKTFDLLFKNFVSFSFPCWSKLLLKDNLWMDKQLKTSQIEAYIP